MSLVLGHTALSVEDVVAVARNHIHVELEDEAQAIVTRARRAVELAASSDQAYYGVNTGVGSLANTHLTAGQQVETQIALIRSHAAGVGPEMPSDVVRAAMLLRARALIQGFSGVTLEAIRRFLDVLNSDFTPVIPSVGSLGCSGDLAQLAHLAAVLFLAEGGAVNKEGELMPASAMHEALELSPVILGPKEGLSLINGTEFMTGSLCLSLHDATTLLASADVGVGLTRAALLAHPDALGEFAQSLRPHPGQLAAAANMRDLQPSEPQMVDMRKSIGTVEPQDPYSLRCSPQVHGAVAGAASHVHGIVSIEINSSTDNPSIDLQADPMKVVSHGNFHGAPLAYAADYLKIVVADLAALSERRVARLIDDKLSRGLSPFLVTTPGPNSGFMIPHYTMAALVNRMRTRAPNSTDTIPTSAGWEDHISMGWNACLGLRESIQDLAAILGIELMVAAQALESRVEDLHERGFAYHLPELVTAALASVRESVAPLEHDRMLSPEMMSMAGRVLDGEFGPAPFVARYHGLNTLQGAV